MMGAIQHRERLVWKQVPGPNPLGVLSGKGPSSGVGPKLEYMTSPFVWARPFCEAFW